jgi:hypothetical protein
MGACSAPKASVSPYGLNGHSPPPSRRKSRVQGDSRLLVALEPTASRGPPPKPSATAEQPEPRGFNRRDDNERAAIRLNMRCVSRKAAVHVTEGRQRPSSSS